MLAGTAVVAIWNGIAPEGRATFYDWHVNEHIPERVCIPGFRRGRRWVAAGPGTAPEFFTLYEVASPEVLTGPDYAARLNAPTAWTRQATAHFRDTTRAAASVVASHGPGAGGVLLTLRLDAPETAAAALGAVAAEAARLPRIIGVHLCRTDRAGSGTTTEESRGRRDLRPPPGWFVLVEATDAAACESAVPTDRLIAAGAGPPMVRGLYRLEYDHHTTIDPGAGISPAPAANR